MPFTTNYNRNPAFQMGLEGYSGLRNANIQLDRTNIKYGSQSCLVSTPGMVSGEGIITAAGVIPGHSICASSIHITGVGSVTISAAINPGGTIVATIPVTCSDQWERHALDGIEVHPGEELYLIIQTTTKQQAQFWISGIQHEDSSPHHDYCDGDRDGCEWSEGFRGGISVCFYPNPVVTTSPSTSVSNLVNILNVGEKFFIGSDSTTLTFSELVSTSGPGPIAAVKDFAVAQLTDPDPAQTYVGWNTGGTASTTGGAYTRNWGIFYPPNDYPISTGANLWNRAAYMAVGWWFVSLPASGTVAMTRIQAEVLPITTGYAQPAPTSFDPPRAIHSIIRPDRLNYCTNPSIEVDTTGWSATGSAAIAKDGTVSVGNIIEYDDNELTSGTASLKVTVNANADGAQTTISDLITGNTYMASAYVQVGPGFENVVMSVANSSATILSVGGTGYGAGTYDFGPYGGSNPTADVSQSTWYRVYCMFTASADSHVLTFSSAAALDMSYPSHMWIDAVLVEDGEILQYYFDGSFGKDFVWEGTAGKSRSYFYDQYALKQNAVINVLNGHVPLGIEYVTPLYATPPIA